MPVGFKECYEYLKYLGRTFMLFNSEYIQQRQVKDPDALKKTSCDSFIWKCKF